MAVVKGPLMSMDARKSVGKTITFTHWKGRNTIRKTVKPHNPKSGLQTGMRAGVRFMSQAYKNLSATTKTRWSNLYKTKKITGLNSMLRFNQPRVRQNLGIFSDNTNTPAAAEAAPTSPVATAQPKSVSISWVDSAGANDYGTLIYMSVTTGFTQDVSNLQVIVPHGVQKFVIAKLITGTPYFFLLRGTANEGTLGTLTAQITATPT